MCVECLVFAQHCPDIIPLILSHLQGWMHDLTASQGAGSPDSSELCLPLGYRAGATPGPVESSVPPALTAPGQSLVSSLTPATPPGLGTGAALPGVHWSPSHEARTARSRGRCLGPVCLLDG